MQVHALSQVLSLNNNIVYTTDRSHTGKENTAASNDAVPASIFFLSMGYFARIGVHAIIGNFPDLAEKALNPYRQMRV